jgi:hypothetical protein
MQQGARCPRERAGRDRRRPRTRSPGEKKPFRAFDDLTRRVDETPSGLEGAARTLPPMARRAAPLDLSNRDEVGVNARPTWGMWITQKHLYCRHFGVGAAVVTYPINVGLGAAIVDALMAVSMTLLLYGIGRVRPFFGVSPIISPNPPRTYSFHSAGVVGQFRFSSARSWMAQGQR